MVFDASADHRWVQAAADTHAPRTITLENTRHTRLYIITLGHSWRARWMGGTLPPVPPLKSHGRSVLSTQVPRCRTACRDYYEVR